LREYGKCHKGDPDQFGHPNLLSLPPGSGMVMPTWRLILFRGSHSIKKSAAALKLTLGDLRKKPHRASACVRAQMMAPRRARDHLTCALRALAIKSSGLRLSSIRKAVLQRNFLETRLFCCKAPGQTDRLR
jgi:hypothetical protein